MKTSHMIAIGAAAVGVGALVILGRKGTAFGMSGDYLPATSVKETEADRQAKDAALLRTAVGAKAASKASSGLGSVFSSMISAAGGGVVDAASQARADDLNKIVPGSGSAFQVLVRSLAAGAGEKVASGVWSGAKSAGSATVNAIKSLKFW